MLNIGNINVMKYKLVPSDNMKSNNIIYIYVLPSSFIDTSYSIIYPDFKAEDIFEQNISIRTFEGCSQDAISDIENKLKEVLKKKQLKYIERLNTFFSAGVGVFILGIINWVIPDPLPFVDELLFTVGGGLAAWKAWKDRKVKLPELIDKTFRYGYEGGRPEVETDSLLTLIFKSIMCRHDPLAAGENIDAMDSIEIESLWMTRYLNFDDISLSVKISRSDSNELVQVLERVFHVRKLAKLEGKKQTLKRRSRLEAFKQETLSKTGLTDNALTVYIEFYRILQIKN